MVDSHPLPSDDVHAAHATSRLAGEDGGRIGGDGGYALVLTALILVPLCIFTASAVDLGAWYAQASRMQRAADAASLAGVVWLPNSAAAVNASNASLSRNWTGSGAAPQCGAGATCGIANGTQWRVEVGQASQLFFAKVANVESFSITRGATAAVNPPIPLGSPLPSFGNNIKPGCIAPTVPPAAPGCNLDPSGNPLPLLWASINGPYRHHQDGDPFATRCWGNEGSENTCTTTAQSMANPAPPGGQARFNPEYKPNGYLYAVDVRTPGAVTVEIYDAACNNGATPVPPAASPGRNVPSDQGCGGDTGTEFQIYRDTGTSQIDTSAANVMTTCTTGTGRMVARPTQGPTYSNRWVTLCTFVAPAAGVYPLQVRNDNIPGICPFTNVQTPNACVGNGINSYAVRSTPNSRVYAIDYMSIWTNVAGVTSTFHLAEVLPVHKGKKVVIDMYDPGDGASGDYTMTFTGPPATVGGSPTNYSCTWKRSGIQDGVSTLSGAPSPCSIATRTSGGGSQFNGTWLHIAIQLPTNYTCPTAGAGADCWWKVRYNFSGGAPTDRTVWTFKVIGDPIHLVE